MKTPEGKIIWSLDEIADAKRIVRDISNLAGTQRVTRLNDRDNAEIVRRASELMERVRHALARQDLILPL